MVMLTVDEMYMMRALQLAECGRGNVSPNPTVGAVIVADGRIVGEGYHRQWGEAHAEVNAVRSVADRSLLKGATIYVTLEPCSHYGKTPPCAKLLVECGFARVVVGMLDPFDKVSGRGVAMLREAGIDVTVGVLEKRCEMLNEVFVTAHRRRMPVVTIKWAQSRDGYMDCRRESGDAAQRFSTGLTSLLTAKLRSVNDVILTTGATVRADNPQLTVRGLCGRNPRPAVLTHAGLAPGSHMANNDRTIVYDTDIADALRDIYERGYTSVLVEGGPTLLTRMIEDGMWDYARVEAADFDLGSTGAKSAPSIAERPCQVERVGANTLYYYRNHRCSWGSVERL